MFSDEAFRIIDVRGRMILDSRGDPTVEAEVVTEGGGVGRAAAPAGASRGRHEAVELRDEGRAWAGRGVERAVNVINSVIAPALIGLDSRKQREIDALLCKLDGTHEKRILGGNSIVAVSLAVAKAAAATAGLPLYRYLGGPGAYVMPVPLLNIINGGAHAGNELSFQEFMIVPVGADSFREAMRIAVEVYKALRRLLIEKYGKMAVNVGDEGGFAPPMRENREALSALVDATKRAGYEPGVDVVYALDVAASQFYNEERGVYIVDGKELDREKMIEYLVSILDEFPVRSVEDPLYEEDFEGFAVFTREASKRGVLVVGDDLYTTNPERLERGIRVGATTAVLVKVNQIGTLTEALEVVNMAHRAGMRAIISHRSGETEDTTIAHLAVGLGTGLIKTGAPARGERTAKYNELLRIEEELGGEAFYPGETVLRPGEPLRYPSLLG
ncbi:enolase [Pyrolobus fumarii 1A]|uniref:Enolase n=1 Tax=Pyrolobus fumarii (strain DSM 11204 / 1A) TaxID=694429 RepID=G0EDB5_PYRF1|nr:enolase [Pyrolobus fumarii 1A]